MKLLISLLFSFIVVSGFGQVMGIGGMYISPAPMAPPEENGTGVIRTTIVEQSSDPAPVGTVPSRLIISLSRLDVADIVNLENSITGHTPYYSVSRLVDGDTIRVIFTQVQDIPGFHGMNIYINTVVTGTSTSDNKGNGADGFFYPGSDVRINGENANVYTFTSEPAPVELGEFNVEKKGNKSNLSWTTYSEINTDYFDVQRSVDGLNFENIGQVDAAGNSPSRLDYSFVDQNPAKGINYYRLRTNDLDSTFEYSETKFLTFGGGNVNRNALITIFPNPTTDFIRLLSNEELDNHVVRLYTPRGSLIRQMPYESGMYVELDNISIPLILVLVLDADKKIVSRQFVVLK